MRQKAELQLSDQSRNGKYLKSPERAQYANTAKGLEFREARTFCMLLHHSGCRIQEGLNVTVRQIDFSAGCVVIESLKKRNKGIFRQIPYPMNTWTT